MPGYNATLRNSRLQKIIDAIDAGPSFGTLEIYDGTQPATGAAITTETKLGILTFSDPCGTVSGGVLTFGTITGEDAALDDGTATWGRILDSDGTFVGDFTVGETSADIIVNSATIVSGGTIDAVGAQTITEGNA